MRNRINAKNKLFPARFNFNLYNVTDSILKMSKVSNNLCKMKAFRKKIFLLKIICTSCNLPMETISPAFEIFPKLIFDSKKAAK